MNTPFTPPSGPFGTPGFGFGAGPAQRRAFHGARRQARREFIENLRENAGGHDGPFGPGFGGPGFGPGFGGPGFGFGRPGFGGPRGGGAAVAAVAGATYARRSWCCSPNGPCTVTR